MAKAIVCLFPENKEEEDEKEKVEENKQQEEENEIRTTMQSSVAMARICTLGKWQLFHFFSSKPGGGGGYNYNESYRAMQQSCTWGEGNCFFPLNEEEEEEEEEEEREKRS